jgi:hypothetical protein
MEQHDGNKGNRKSIKATLVALKLKANGYCLCDCNHQSYANRSPTGDGLSPNSSHVNMQTLSLSLNLFHVFHLQMETSTGAFLMWSGGFKYLKISFLLSIYIDCYLF